MTVAFEGTTRVSVVFSAGDEGKADDADLQPVSRTTAATTAAKGQRGGEGGVGAFRTAILHNQFSLLFFFTLYIIKGESSAALVDL